MTPQAEAAAEWLLIASPDPAGAREEWERDGVTVLRAGGSFCAMRVPVSLVEAVAPDASRAAVDAYLGEALHQAPAFRCDLGRYFYVLVRPTVATWWDSRGEVACIGESHPIAVPRPDLVGHPARAVSYWAVPMIRTSQLGSGRGLSELVAAARLRMTQQEGTS